MSIGLDGGLRVGGGCIFCCNCEQDADLNNINQTRDLTLYANSVPRERLFYNDPFHWRSSPYSVTHFYNKNSNIQGRLSNVVKVISQTRRNCSKKKEFNPSASKFFPLREVPILKRNAIEENLCLIQ